MAETTGLQVLALVAGANVPSIKISERQLDDVVDDVVGALIKANHPPRFFTRGESIVTVRRAETGRPFMQHLRGAPLVNVLSQVAKYFVEKSGQPVPA